jgi:hypothetical protein
MNNEELVKPEKAVNADASAQLRRPEKETEEIDAFSATGGYGARRRKMEEVSHASTWRRSYSCAKATEQGREPDSVGRVGNQ